MPRRQVKVKKDKNLRKELNEELQRAVGRIITTTCVKPAKIETAMGGKRSSKYLHGQGIGILKEINGHIIIDTNRELHFALAEVFRDSSRAVPVLLQSI